MTCIVAQKTETGVLLGADSAMIEGSRIFRRATPKLWHPEDTTRVVVGTAGAARFVNILRNANWPTDPILAAYPDERADVLANFLRPLCDPHTTDKRGVWAIVAIDREIFYVDCEIAISRIDADYCALGSGEEVALGALFALERMRDALPLDAKTALTIALDAAHEHTVAARPPYAFLGTVAPERTAPSRPFNPMVGRVLG